MKKLVDKLNIKYQFLVILVFCLIIFTGCTSGEVGDKFSPPKSGTIIITGNGIETPTKLTVKELKAMDAEMVTYAYSCVNNWPIKKFFVAKGIPILYLLEQAQIKDSAQTIIITGADGYEAYLTKEQLEELRYSYPRLIEGDSDGQEEVAAILAWEHLEGTNDISQLAPGKLKFFIGQKGLNDVTTAAFVKDVVAIQVTIEPPSHWERVQAKPQGAKVALGTEVFLTHPDEDYIQIYYTLDGSPPDENSQLYNISASYYQPHLIKPIIINESLTINAIAVGLGKHHSEIATFTYAVE